MRLHRKTLLTVGGSCLSAAGGRRGGRYMWGLRERSHIPAHTVHVALLKDTRTHASVKSFLLLTSSSSLSWSAQERVWEPFRKKGEKNMFSIFKFESWSFSFCCVCFFSICRCKIRTIWCLCVTDGRHGFQGGFQRQLNVGNHWAEGWRLFCGDLHGKHINTANRTEAKTHTERETQTGRMHMQVNERDSTGKGTDDRDKEDTC